MRRLDTIGVPNMEHSKLKNEHKKYQKRRIRNYL